MIAATDPDDRYVKATVRHSVTVLQPLADHTHQPVSGQILGECTAAANCTIAGSASGMARFCSHRRSGCTPTAASPSGAPASP